MRLCNIFAGALVVSLAVMLCACHDRNDLPGNGLPGADDYVGSTREMVLGPEAAGFNGSRFTLVLQTENGTLIRRDGSHMRSGAASRLDLETGLRDGVYRMLYLEYPIADNVDLSDLADEFETTQYGLGSRIEVSAGKVTVLDAFDTVIDLPGSGTADDPYEISSYHSLIKLARYVNSAADNSVITADTHFRQSGAIDMYQASREIDRRYGWLPIGASPALPFRGHYHGAGISTLICDRSNSAGVGLFGYVHNAVFDGVEMSNSLVNGNFGVGALVGASLVGGDDRGLCVFTGCRVEGCEINGGDDSASAGGLIGAVDMHSRAYLQDCESVNNTIGSDYNAGGLVGAGALYSCIQLNTCANYGSVSTRYSGAGGLVGTCDTVYMTACSNRGTVSGGTGYSAVNTSHSAIGAGGLVGGSGPATLISSYNSGDVSGYAGVGGLAGSTRIKGSDNEAYMYNNVVARYCYNEGPVRGEICVGGITGEAQIGTYAVYNTGTVSGTDYVGGVAGCTSIAVVHNAVNTGAVSGHNYVAGVVAKTVMGSVALDHNYGKVTATGTHCAGIAALAGNNTVVHYCGNYGLIDSDGNGPAGGIIGEVGDPRKWTAMNIAECVVGSLEVVMAVAGPVIAVTEHFIEEAAETLAIFLHVSEVVSDGALLITDSVLWGIGLSEMLEPGEVETLEAGVNETGRRVNDLIKENMAVIRAAGAPTLAVFDPVALSGAYNRQVQSTLDFYETEGGSDTFNENINLVREERAEHLEKMHETNEIIHTVVGAVCIVAGTVAAIGGVVASGGAAVPFIIAGSAASLAGGLNALTKSCMEFEENVVIISQCVNAGEISAAAGDAGGLVGRLQDNSILRDCLNTGSGPHRGSPFAHHTGNAVSIDRCLSVADPSTWGSVDDMSGCSDAIVYRPGADGADCDRQWHYNHVALYDVSGIADIGSYTRYTSGWDVGRDDAHKWIMGSSASNAFPVPAYSEMRK